MAAVVLATLVRAGLERSYGLTAPFIIHYPAVLLVAIIAGTGPGVLAVVLSALAADYWFLPPVGFGIGTTGDAIALGIFVGLSLSLCVLAEQMRRARWAMAISAAQAEELALVNLGNLLALNPQHRIIRWSEGCRRLYGFECQEAEGRLTEELFQTRYPQPREQIRRTVFEQGHWEGELIHHRKDGAEIIVASQWVLRRDHDGRPVAILEVNNDITKQKLAEEALRQQREWFRVTLTSIGDAVIACDTQAQVTFLNPTAESLTGWKQEEALGRPIQSVFKIINEKTRQPSGDLVAQVLKEQGVVALANHTALIAKDGREFPVEDSAAPIMDAAGNVAGVVLVFHDVTEKRRTQDALRESQQDLNHAQELAHIGSWRLDIRRNELRWCDEVYRIFGIPTGTPLTYETFLSAVHPEDREYVDRMWKAALHGDSYDIEHRIIVGDSVKWVRERAELEFDEQGGLLGGFGAVQDITDRKKIEESLFQAKEEWERTFDSMPDLIAILDQRHRIVRMNRAMAERLGHTPEECLGSLCYQGVHGTDAPPSFCPHALTLADGRQHIAEVHEDRLGGDFLVSTTPICDSQGQMTGSVHVAHDITERKRAEIELQREKTFANTVIDSLPGVFYLFDTDGHFLRWNKNFEQVTGYSATELAEMSPWDFFRGADRDRIRQEVQRIFEMGETTVEADFVSKDKGVTPYLFTGLRVHLADGQCMAGTGLDVSVRKRAEQSLRKVNAELARKNADIEQLLYTVSHDLKSPLVTIQGFLGLLGSDAKAARLDRVLDYSQRVQNAANRMGRLLDDLLNFNRIGRVANEPVSINLTELVREVVSSHAQELASTKISVGVQEDMPVIVGDKHRLHQVLDNLLVNAIKYGSGADRPLIEIGGRQENEEMRVFVKDNGKGIAPEYHKRVFDLFHCLESNKGGTGVGLAIVKKIVEVHGGRAWVESTPGAGATFWLSFPAKKEPQGGGISES